MAAPATPSPFYVQQGNGQVYLSWGLSAGATSYPIFRSTDGITFSSLASPSASSYLDSSVVVGTQYYYYVQASSAGGTSSATSTLSIVPAITGQMSLAQIRLNAQQRADLVNSGFISPPEWNTYITQSAFELYDLLITTYEDYFVKTPLLISTDGINNQFTLPTDFYKLMGVDIGLANNSNAWVSVPKFDFIARNQYVYPSVTSSYFGVFNLKYRLVGNTLMCIPTPQAGQFLRVWYIPRLTQLLQDSDILDGVSGWTEYVIVDAAIKAMQKEESDVSILGMEKTALIKRIEESAMNRDVGQPDTISDTRSISNAMGWSGSGGTGWM